MIAKMPVVANYTFKMFLTFYILQAAPPNVMGPGLTYPFYSPSRRAWVQMR